MRVKAVVPARVVRREPGRYSLSVELPQHAMDVVQKGDLLVYDGLDMPLARKRRWRV
ncbi:hypothetical protein [Candidatus Burkholderia verschuerenii]|uniref:hypothetical protein n=1 Tax=Candidatus Burkholderia verschuerenii TaxID=242163 RepID=UPI0012EDBB6F|nr:hypothetical protein [Candidatus Burkholderia verschuerenii]